MKRRDFVIRGGLTGVAAIGVPLLIKKVLSLNPLEQRVKRMLHLGENEIDQSFTFSPLMQNSKYCEENYAKIYAAAITHNQKPEHNIIIYTPTTWESMQVSIFENQKKHLAIPYEPGNFTLQLIPYQTKKPFKEDDIFAPKIKSGLYTYWNNTGGILDNRTNTEIGLSLELQKQVDKFYNKLQNIVHGMQNKKINLTNCRPTKQFKKSPIFLK